MTDNEIIKALECCVIDTNCTKCPHYNNGKQTRECLEISMIAALDLIKRQRATIDMFDDIGKLYSEIKAEAYKEFADRLKQVLYNDEYILIRSIIDNLLKELAGDKQ